jgi:hypothetical protein
MLMERRYLKVVLFVINHGIRKRYDQSECICDKN